jgi:hypothetical protein
MAILYAENTEVMIEDGRWRVFDSASSSLSPVFEADRGGGVLRYAAAFGEARNLPGTKLSAGSVRSVVAGYDQSTGRWRLGIYYALRDDEKPRWAEILRWPAGQDPEYGEAAQKAGRVLAEYVACPLKLFGVTKTPAAARMTITGPLAPHKRVDLDPAQVKIMAQNIQLPKQYQTMWIGSSGKGVTLRLAKEATAAKPGEVAPAFQLCEVDTQKQNIRLVPPTGLLGAFFSGTQGRVIRFGEVRNIEYRHTFTQTSSFRKDTDDKMVTELLTKHHTWEIYVTIPNESVLLAKTEHSRDATLSRQRIEDVAGGRFGSNFEAAVDYYRQHERDQQQLEAARNWAHSAAIVIAAAVGCRLVSTEVGDELGMDDLKDME